MNVNTTYTSRRASLTTTSTLPHEGMVYYNLELNEINVSGKFIGPKAHEKHQRLLTKIDDHLELRGQLTLRLNYSTFDTSTLAYILKIMKSLNKAHKEDKRLHIIWEYSDNEEMLDVGLDLVPFCDFNLRIHLD